MTINDLVEGEIYSSYSANNLYVFQCGENKTYRYRHRVVAGSKAAYAENSTYGSTITNHLRLPSEDEKIWLLACISAGEYIPIEEALNIYQIY